MSPIKKKAATSRRRASRKRNLPRPTKAEKRVRWKILGLWLGMLALAAIVAAFFVA